MMVVSKTIDIDISSYIHTHGGCTSHCQSNCYPLCHAYIEQTLCSIL